MSRLRRADWFDRRRAGILLPVNALALPDGGDALGSRALRFLQFLSDAGVGLWQMLPLHPTDAHASPYQGSSAFACDVRLLGPESARSGAADRAAYDAFRAQAAYWLDDYALFTAIRAACGQRPWWDWPAELRGRDAAALAGFRAAHAAAIDRHGLEQFLFHRRWGELRDAARARGILLFGDMPLFVAHDSADVWSHPEYFQLDAGGQPTAVAGVPPDYFSATGQRWGNPLYDWRRLAETGFQWWVERARAQLHLFDVIRVDHFRGLEAVWEIPAHCPTAERGEWRPVPGEALLKTLRGALGSVPCVAEDLGIITPPVEKLRRRFHLPGIKVLQFAFDGDARNPYLPHNLEADSVVYTGTHDNNTTVGWFEGLEARTRARVLEYLRHPAEPMPWPLIHAALASVCRFAIVPMQDVLGLGAEHRTNTPGTVDGNWRYRLDIEQLKPDLAARLRRLNELYGRA